MAQPANRPDPTIYPDSDDMGENSFEVFVRLFLLPIVMRFLASQGKRLFVGSNQFVYWEQGNPRRALAPDLYTLPALSPDAEPACIKTWELGRGGVPPFALEIVSVNKSKDYIHAPRRYDELGTNELVVYDPEFETRRDGVKWQVFRRLKGRGLVRVEATNEDRVKSKQLGCYLREVPHGGSLRLRVGVGRRGDELFPTEAEQERAEKEAARAEKEAARAEKEAARFEKDRERAEKEAARAERERERAARQKAEARVAELEAELRALRAKRKR